MMYSFYKSIIELTEIKLHEREWKVKSSVNKDQTIIDKLKDASAMTQVSMISVQDT